MPEVSSIETEAQTRTRSALGGFERDAKTFEGHLQRITASAEAFVKRCAKFSISDPDHPRLAETAELLAEAKRIIGKSEPAPTGDAPAAYFEGVKIEPLRGPETWQLADAIRGLVDRVRLLEAKVYEDPEDMPPGMVALGLEIAMLEARDAAMHETGIADGIDTTAPEPVDPLASLKPDAAARVQAAIDQAAAKRAAEMRAEPAPAQALVNPFAGLAATVAESPAPFVNPFAPAP